MIEPTVGRVVHFTPSKGSAILKHEQPLAAIITYVWNPRMVNLAVFDANGATHACTSVTLLQDEDVPNEAGYYAQWMPLQKGQAAKTEAITSRLEALGIAGNAL
ncbi:hypothetical protein [Burkholderia sp. Bp8990]|uniref:hypothetical protein n=1 Tax=Burkholderia sp. Bp8990 TaxID=2184552 RepID=UPI000F59FFE8|nr:hypothetical protein [Burkholderia sp. Bp8990]RQS39760.1 hypothetical protein DIE01_16235 [Burkholderia sp. Bp8990]